MLDYARFTKLSLASVTIATCVAVFRLLGVQQIAQIEFSKLVDMDTSIDHALSMYADGNNPSSALIRGDTTQHHRRIAVYVYNPTLFDMNKGTSFTTPMEPPARDERGFSDCNIERIAAGNCSLSRLRGCSAKHILGPVFYAAMDRMLKEGSTHSYTGSKSTLVFVTDPALAEVFYVPVLFTESFIYQPETHEANVRQMGQILQSSEYYERHQGADHFIVVDHFAPLASSIAIPGAMQIAHFEGDGAPWCCRSHPSQAKAAATAPPGLPPGCPAARVCDSVCDSVCGRLFPIGYASKYEQAILDPTVCGGAFASLHASHDATRSSDRFLSWTFVGRSDDRKAYRQRDMLRADWMKTPNNIADVARVDINVCHQNGSPTKKPDGYPNCLNSVQAYSQLMNSTFALQLSGDTPTTDRIFSILFTNTVPIVLSDELGPLLDQLPFNRDLGGTKWRDIFLVVDSHQFSVSPVHSITRAIQKVTPDNLRQYWKAIADVKVEMAWFGSEHRPVHHVIEHVAANSAWSTGRPTR
jgi:hypothetical protein